jgi:hypothetical protein
MSIVAYFLLHNGQPSARRLLSRVERLRGYTSVNEVTSSDYVIRYGVSNESDPASANIINRQNAIMRTGSRLKMGRFLRRVGVRFILPSSTESGDTTRFIRHYRIPFFDLQPIACFRADIGMAWINKRIQRVQPNFRETSPYEDKVSTRACWLGARALQALGLDYGLVSLGLGPKGVVHVIDVTPSPVLEGRMLELYARAINEFMDREERLSLTGIQQVTLGTDVEIMLRNQEGKLVLASTYFPRKGRVGCDDRSIAYDGKRLPLVELRPEPNADPLTLISNLRETLAEGVRKINRPKVEWRAGSMPFRPYCTGAHIHFSNVPLSSHFAKVLDNYLGIFLMAVENPVTAQLRRPKYGALGDIRQKNYGGFEYRTPASFIVDRGVTTAAFCLAYLIALYHRELPWFDIYDVGAQIAFYQNDVNTLWPIMQRNMERIRNLPLYDRYQEQIEVLFDMISNRKTWNENLDVRDIWGIQKQQILIKKPVRAKQAQKSG